MSAPQESEKPARRRSGFDSSDTLLIEVDGPGDTTMRPVSPQHIAAVKRYWERLGRTPPPPYDKL